MNKKELINAISADANLNTSASERALNSVIKNITEALSSGNSVSLVGFGTFDVRERSARKGRNPKTGETIDIPASKAAAFKPGKALKEAVNQ